MFRIIRRRLQQRFQEIWLQPPATHAQLLPFAAVFPFDSDCAPLFVFVDNGSQLA